MAIHSRYAKISTLYAKKSKIHFISECSCDLANFCMGAHPMRKVRESLRLIYYSAAEVDVLAKCNMATSERWDLMLGLRLQLIGALILIDILC